jgi:diguanylate cyclase (GGDEF)-like protein/PAS domain S-box-containing protein
MSLAPGEQHEMTAPQRPLLAEGLFMQALDAVSEGSLITDANQRIIYANAAIRTITGFSEAEMLGKNCNILQGPDTDPETIQLMRDSFAAGVTFRGDILNYRKDGAPFWNALTITPLKDDSGDVTHFVSVQRDISPLMDLQEQLLYQATHDAVTGLPNRVALGDQLTDALTRAQRRGTVVAVGMLDLDDFKRINDTHGHLAGDDVLRAVSRRFTGCIRDDDFLARLGGDEFLVVFEGLNAERPVDGLQTALTRLADVLAEPIELGDGVRLQIGMSMGIAFSPGHAMDANGLMRVADDALYSIKAQKQTRNSWWHVAGEQL